MACGCPIVATPVGGIPEIAAEHIGVLTLVGNSRKLAESINKASSIDRSVVREEALRFSWRKVSETILSLL
jgi:glycosyltransferase involved in cell wall biosynthesis